MAMKTAMTMQQMTTDPALVHLPRVVVLVLDLNRGLLDTVAEMLEAIRPFRSSGSNPFTLSLANGGKR